MPCRSLRCLPLLLAGVLAPALADDAPAYTRCMDAAGGVTSHMLDCIAAELGAQDVRLNRSYRAAMGALGADQQTRLRDAQRLWIQYRDANCTLLGSLTGGSIDRINGAACLLGMTQERADELAQIGEGW